MLRAVLEDVEAKEISLRHELKFVELYLAIEQARFQDRLRIHITAGAYALDAAVPHLLLQAVVESAIRHGIGRSSAAGKIDITAQRTGDTLRIEVRDDGPGIGAPSLAGIVNITRIRELEPLAHGEYVVTLTFGVRLQSSAYSEKLRALATNPF